MLKFKKHTTIILASFSALIFAFIFSTTVGRSDNIAQKGTDTQAEMTSVISDESLSENASQEFNTTDKEMSETVNGVDSSTDICINEEYSISDEDIVLSTTSSPSESTDETLVQTDIDAEMRAESTQACNSQAHQPALEPSASYIDVKNYVPYISYSGISEDALFIIDQIFSVINNHSAGTGNCDNHKVYESREYCCLEPPCEISEDVCAEVRSFFVLYCGDFNIQKDIFACLLDAPNHISALLVPIEIMVQVEQKRNVYIDRVESVLSSFREGTTEEKINSFSSYIVSNSVYERDMISIDDFWLRGKANCNVYAMVLREFAERIGVPCDVVVGHTASGEYHAWNRITLPDGSYRYYDLSFYESTRNAKYLNSSKNLHNQAYINRYSA